MGSWEINSLLDRVPSQVPELPADLCSLTTWNYYKRTLSSVLSPSSPLALVFFPVSFFSSDHTTLIIPLISFFNFKFPLSLSRSFSRVRNQLRATKTHPTPGSNLKRPVKFWRSNKLSSFIYITGRENREEDRSNNRFCNKNALLIPRCPHQVVQSF